MLLFLFKETDIFMIKHTEYNYWYMWYMCTEQLSFEFEFLHSRWPSYIFQMLEDCRLSKHLQKQQDDTKQIF
jgi:hypothetical protein